MSKWNGIERRKSPRKVSLKKQRALAQEAKVHAVISQRANNHCEICRLNPCAPTYHLSTHELVFRSAGGQVNEDNSKKTCDCCHTVLQRYMLLTKSRCIYFIMQSRNTDIKRATEIYRRIYEFAEKHGLLRESKLNGYE